MASEGLTLRLCQIVWVCAVVERGVAAVLDLPAG